MEVPIVKKRKESFESEVIEALEHRVKRRLSDENKINNQLKTDLNKELEKHPSEAISVVHTMKPVHNNNAHPDVLDDEKNINRVDVEMKDDAEPIQALYPRLNNNNEDLFEPLINEQLNWLDLSEQLHRPAPKYRAPFNNDGGFDLAWNDDELYVTLKQFKESLHELEQLHHRVEAAKTRARDIEERQLWTEERQTAVFNAGKCGDGATLKPQPITFSWMKFHPEQEVVLHDAHQSLLQLEHTEVVRAQYEATRAKIKCHVLIDELLSTCHLFAGLHDMSPVTASNPALRAPMDLIPLNKLRHVLAVLFYFAHQPSQDVLFLVDVRAMIVKVVSVWLRNASYDDHVLILTHLVHTPGLGTWAAQLLQFPFMDDWKQADIRHFLASVSAILTPVTVPVHDTAALVLLEEDLIALFKQCPFGLFLEALFAQGANDVTSVLDTCHGLIDILTCSLVLSDAHKDLPKRVTEEAVNVARHLALFANSLLTSDTLTSAQLTFVQQRVDYLLSKIFLRILQQSHTALWLFTVHLPFGVMSRAALAQLFFITFAGTDLHIELPNLGLSGWLAFVKEPKNSAHREFLANRCNDSNAEYLLHALAKMAVATTDSPYVQLSRVIMHELFIVAYAHPKTRGVYYKSVRGLIAEICATHPNMIGTLMQYVRDNIAAVGQGCLHLFKSISFYGYKPVNEDIKLLEEWLQSPLDGHLVQLAQYIFDNLNWQWNLDARELFLDPATHRDFALILGRSVVYHRSRQESLSIFGYQTSKLIDKYLDWARHTVLHMKFHTLACQRLLITYELSDPQLSELYKHVFKPYEDKTKSSEAALSAQLVHGAEPSVVYLLLQLTDLASTRAAPEHVIGTHTLPTRALFDTLCKALLQHKQLQLVLRVLADQGPDLAAISQPLEILPWHSTLARDVIEPLLQSEFQVSGSVNERLTALTSRGASVIGALLVSLITAQMTRVTQHEHVAHQASSVVLFWLKMFCANSEWHRASSHHVLVDQLVKHAVTLNALEHVLQLVAQLNIAHKTAQPNSPSVLTWLVSGLKEANKFISHLISEKVMKRALLLDPSQPMTPLYWQLFFARYFSVTTEGRVFGHVLLRHDKLKSSRDAIIQRLEYLTDHHTTQAKKLHENFEENKRYIYQLHVTLSELYLAMHEWIKIDWDDWHVSQLAELPPHLQPARVNALLAGVTTQTLWWDSVNMPLIHEQLTFDAVSWQTWTEQYTVPPTRPVKHNNVNHVPVNNVNHAPAPDMSINGNNVNVQPVPNHVPAATPSAPGPMLPEGVLPPPKYSNTAPRATRLPLSQVSNVTHHASALVTAAQRYETRSTEHEALLRDLRTRLQSLWRVELKHLRKVMSCGPTCARPVEFVCQIQERAVNENSKALVDNLHELTAHVDYVVDEELCVHALTVELTLNQLTARYDSESDAVKRKEFFDSATMLYFWMHNAMNAAVSAYPPSRILFEHVLTQLARDYLATAGEHVTQFMTSVLRDSKSLQLFVDHFNPNIAPEQFITCYKIAVDHVTKFDPQLTATLFRRFDVARWLSTGPAVTDVAQLITLSGSVAAKSAPPGSVLDLPLQVTLSHFALLSRADWPRHVHATLQFVADQSRRAKIDPRVWDIILALPFSERLKSAQLINILIWLNQYLMTIKRHKNQNTLFEMLQNYREKLFLLFDRLFSECLKEPGFNDTALLDAMLTFYDCWLFPVKENTMPAWSAEQQTEARDVLTALMAHLTRYHALLPHHRAINRLWQWWCAKELAHDPVTGVTRMTSLLAPHQVALFCDLFDHVAWQELTPDTQTSEQLLSLVNLYYHYNDDSAARDKQPLQLFFSLRHVLRLVPWERVAEVSERYWALLLSCCLAYLTAHADNVPPQPDLDPFFALARTYPWHLVTEKSLQELNVFQIYLIDRYRAVTLEMARDATFVTRVTAVVDFIAAVFAPIPQINHVLTTAEALLNHVVSLEIPRIQSHTALVAAFISLPIIGNAVSAHMVSHVIRAVEHVVGTLLGLLGGAESARVEELITTLLHVLLRVFNLTDKVSLGDLIQHLEARDPIWQATALYMVRACARSIASEQKQVALIEACLEADLLLHQNWTRLQHALIVPDIGQDVFLQHCVESGAAIILCTFVSQVSNRVPSEVSQIDILLSKLMNWTNQIRTIKGKEMKVLLLVSKTIQLLFDKCQSLTADKAGTALYHLAEWLHKFAEAREGGGLIAFFGMGAYSHPPAVRAVALTLSAWLKSQCDSKSVRVRQQPLSRDAPKMAILLAQYAAPNSPLSQYATLFNGLLPWLTDPTKSLADTAELLKMARAACTEPLDRALLSLP
eukprot:TRINITY_DN2791_c0_g1_i2.p1 TRINITY_DN2791_c0_g1~~TRINITY_DN2791_c0_g1_i2.p1  ORF type:complete len:2311 (-),score=837.94 TRINITY_DN2791_c0_g1_i2:31-6963(-)